MDGIGIEDAQGRHVGAVIMLERRASPAEDLYGWTVSLPGHVVRNVSRRTIGRDAALAEAIAAAAELGVDGPHAPDAAARPNPGLR